ncbi:MAG: imelysin family protein [Pseudomonadota bacterium]
MMRSLMVSACLLLPQVGMAQELPAIVATAVESHILPRHASLVAETSELSSVTQEACLPGDPTLEAAFHAAFDAWINVSHITFGPSEADGRFFALSFWPDTRGVTGRSLSDLIASEDAAVGDPAAYAEVSVAARGFYALEFLLFDDAVSTQGNPDYRCALVQAIAADIAATSAEIYDEWTDGFAELMLTAGSNERFRSAEEAAQVLFGTLTTGLEFTTDLRIGRPLGSFDSPRPNRAEARRSGRSLHHVELSLTALADLARILSEGDPRLQSLMADEFAAALERANTLDDPTFMSVAEPQGRIRVEALQLRIRDVRALAVSELGPRLGVAAGFNALDGD